MYSSSFRLKLLIYIYFYVVFDDEYYSLSLFHDEKYFKFKFILQCRIYLQQGYYNEFFSFDINGFIGEFTIYTVYISKKDSH